MYKRTATQWSSKGIKQLMSGESLNKRREGEYLYKRAATELRGRGGGGYLYNKAATL